MKLSNHFNDFEFFSKDFYQKLKTSNRPATWYISLELISILEKIRKHFNKIIIVNNWYHGGAYQLRGFRTYDEDQTVNKKTLPSQHSLGKACDFNVFGIENSEVQKFIRTKIKKGGLGSSQHYTHYDVRPTDTLIEWRY